MINVAYIHTMDFDFRNVKVINCKTTTEFEEKIKNGEVVLVEMEDGTIYGINTSYIIYFC